MKKIHENKNNKKFNVTVNKIHAEMDSVKNITNGWSLLWKENYSDVYCYELQFLSRENITCLEDRYDGLYDLSRYHDDSRREGQAIERITLMDVDGEEYVCEFRKIDWLLSNGKIFRNFTFVNTGGISYSQTKRKRGIADQSYDYYAIYDVNNNDLTIRFVNGNTDICFINSDLRQYSFENKTIAEDETCITVIENKDEQSRLEIELDRAGNVIRKHLMQGEYNYVIEGEDVVSAFVGDDQLEKDDELMNAVTDMIAKFEIGMISDDELFDYVNNIKSRVINAIKGIKGDVPIQGLLRRLDVALSMISIKKIIHPEVANNIKEKKRN